MKMQNQKLWIITVGAMIIVVLFTSLCISGTIPNVMTTIEGSPGNISSETITPEFTSFPQEIRGGVKELAEKYSIAPDTWGFDTVNNEIDLLSENIHNASAIRDLQGKQIGNSTIRIFNNTELETSKAEVRTYLQELMKKPGYQIDNFGMVSSPSGPYAEVWCTRMTPENQKLDNTTIKGWKILVYPMSPLPLDTKNSSGSIASK